MKKNIICLLIAVLTANFAWAVPARLGSLKHTQPDGTEVVLQKIGDERSHMTLSQEGYPVALDADGFYCFAHIDDRGMLSPMDIKVKEFSALSQSEQTRVKAVDLSKIEDALVKRREATKLIQKPKLISRAGGGIGLMDDALLGRKELKGLVILAEYQDVRFSGDYGKEFFDEMLNREGFNEYGATGSARDYFVASSMGQFTPEFDVYGPVTLPKNMAYYGQNTSTGDDVNPARMIYDACLALDGEINFADYDLDGDGVVENVFVFYAGYGEASYGEDDSIWPHQWDLTSARLDLTLDGVTIDKYACSNELDKDSFNKDVPCGIGTFVHEFSHVLGLPDLYDTSRSSSWTPSAWSVLDQGPYNNKGRTPPAYSVYERYALGWIEPIVISGPENISLEAIDEANVACIIPTKSENEFFLLENRQQHGWDEYIPGHGMLIWHIDYNAAIWQRNAVNTKSTHNYVDIEEACGKWYDIKNYYTTTAYYRAIAEYAFPGPKEVTSFTDDTTPSMRTWSGAALSLPITDIKEEDGVISFLVAGGKCNAEVPVVKEPNTIGDNWFEAAWEPSEGAVDYRLTVRPYADGEEYGEDVANFGKPGDISAALPEGWEFISTSGLVYNDAGYFGDAAPAMKLSKTGVGLKTPVYDRDIVSCEFWVRGQGINASSKIIVEGLVNGNWTKLEEMTPSTTVGEVYSIKAIPSGLRQIQITYQKSIGNVAVDDFTIKFYNPTVALEEYESREVGNVTSFIVNSLPAGWRRFAYKVSAIDDEGHQSAWSEEQIVDLDASAGIADLVAGDNGTIEVDGTRVVWQGTKAASISLVDLFGRVVATASADDNGAAVVTAPGPGLYLLTTPGGTSKLVVK